MSAYKQFTTKDMVITPFSANKGFRFKGNKLTASNVGVEVYFGTQPPIDKLIFETTKVDPWASNLGTTVSGSQNFTGFVNKQNTNSVYSSAIQLYYSNYFESPSGSQVPTSSLLYGLEGERNNTFSDNNQNIEIGLSGSNNIPIGAIQSPQYDNYLSSTVYKDVNSNSGPQMRTALLGETLLPNANYLNVISIPSKLWGKNIEPQSFSLDYNPTGTGTGNSDFKIWDDGDGNLRYSYPFQSITNDYIGNICYSHGMAIMTPISESNQVGGVLATPNNLGWLVLEGQNGYSGTNNLQYLTIGWSSSVILYEHQYKCVVRENEFGYSLNPSVLSGSQSQQVLPGTNNVYKDFATGSYFSPYITTVGLYDDDQNLLAIGKLSVPTKVPMNADLEIQVAFDSI
jgi:hypothetical protein